MGLPSRAFLLLGLFLTTFPVAAGGRDLGRRALAPTSYIAAGEQVAFAGGRFLTVWQQSMGPIGRPIMGAFSDANGRRISERAFALDLPQTLSYVSMHLTGAGDSFALFWPGAGATHMARIDLDGRVTSVHTLDLPSNQFVSAVAWNGTHFLALVHVPGSPAETAWLFDGEGRTVRGPLLLPHSGWVFDVVVVNGRFVTFIGGRGGISVQTITAEGLIAHRYIDPSGFSSRPIQLPVRFAATETPVGDVLFVWSFGSSDSAQLKSVIYRADGSLTEPVLLAEGAVAPIELLRTGDTYVLALSVAEPSRQLMPRVMRLDAAGAKESEAVAVPSPLWWSASAAASGTTILLVYQPADVFLIETLAIGADGRARAPEVVSIDPVRQMQPVLGAGGGSVFAVWTEIAHTTGSVEGAVVDADGEPRFSARVAPSFLAARELGWSGVHYLVVHQDGTRLLATRVGPDGRVFDDDPIPIARIEDKGVFGSVVWTGDRWLVVWRERAQMKVATVSAGGVPRTPRRLAIEQPLPAGASRMHLSAPALAFDGRYVLLVWTESYVAPFNMPNEVLGQTTFATRLTGDGEPFGNTVEIERHTSGFYEDIALSAASSGREFMVTTDTRATVVEGDHALLRTTATRVLFDSPEAACDVTWDGRDYVVAMRYRLFDYHLALHRLDRKANEAAATRGIRTPPPDLFAPPSVAAPFAGNAIVGVQEGTAAEGVRAVVYHERDLMTLPPPPAPPRNVRVQYVGGAQYIVTWDPSPSGEPELYVVEREVDGEWAVAERVSGKAVSALIYTSVPTGIRVRALNAGGASEPAFTPTPPKRRAVR